MWKKKTLTRFIDDNNMAVLIRISCISRYTITCWHVISDLTDCCRSTYTWTRIFALIFNTCFVVWTVLIYNTFRSTRFIWIAKIAFFTNASSSS